MVELIQSTTETIANKVATSSISKLQSSASPQTTDACNRNTSEYVLISLLAILMVINTILAIVKLIRSKKRANSQERTDADEEIDAIEALLDESNSTGVNIDQTNIENVFRTVINFALKKKIIISLVKIRPILSNSKSNHTIIFL